MSVRFSNEVEQEEAKQDKRSPWELYRTSSIVEVVHKARDMEWGQSKVQVRAEHVASDAIEYVIEPYEHGCSCRGLLKYSDYFEPSQHADSTSVK